MPGSSLSLKVNMDGIIFVPGGILMAFSNTLFSNKDFVSRFIDSSHCLENSPDNALFALLGVVAGMASSKSPNDF